MWEVRSRPISQGDYLRYKAASFDARNEFVGWAAHFSAYPPAGYGFSNPAVTEINGEYFATWQSRDNCD